MKDNKTNQNSLDSTKREELLSALHSNKEILILQAEIAQLRATLARAQMEELAYITKIAEIRNNTPNEQPQSKASTEAS